ncbi:MAG: hypothetical protein BWY10_02216 [Chloroflexi bacterium ADurb.Bin180]|nr:MAG: hypothetical protein BWY10_02216 [Chloroflexi bacterium ADurb.Bin180]
MEFLRSHALTIWVCVGVALVLRSLWSLMRVASREDRRAVREFERWQQRRACNATMKTLVDDEISPIEETLEALEADEQYTEEA